MGVFVIMGCQEEKKRSESESLLTLAHPGSLLFFPQTTTITCFHHQEKHFVSISVVSDSISCANRDYSLAPVLQTPSTSNQTS